MNDRAPIRDRTLVLKVLVPRLDQRLREKMKEAEEGAAGGGGNGKSSLTSPNKASSAGNYPSAAARTSPHPSPDSLLDLDGVSCEPTSDRNRNNWRFHCDGEEYPAQLVNLPCPVEIHKTLDHASYYKAGDIAQMLIVYEDALSLDEAMQEKPVEGFPSYYHSGLTPPMHRVVERRFEKCFTSRDRKAVAPPRAAVQDVEEELLELMQKLQKDEKGGGGGGGSSKARSNKLPVLTTATKDLVEIEEEVVDYEPWMDDNGKLEGIEFEADNTLAKVHPEIWLAPDTIKSIQEECQAIEEEAARKAAEEAAAKAAAAKPKKKKSKKKAKAAEAAAAAAEDAEPKPKKGIPSRKNATPVDDIDLAALGALAGDNAEDLGDDLGDLGFDFGDLDGLDL